MTGKVHVLFDNVTPYFAAIATTTV